jgi:hypothetical protein
VGQDVSREPPGGEGRGENDLCDPLPVGDLHGRAADVRNEEHPHVGVVGSAGGGGVRHGEFRAERDRTAQPKLHLAPDGDPGAEAAWDRGAGEGREEEDRVALHRSGMAIDVDLEGTAGELGVHLVADGVSRLPCGDRDEVGQRLDDDADALECRAAVLRSGFRTGAAERSSDASRARGRRIGRGPTGEVRTEIRAPTQPMLRDVRNVTGARLNLGTTRPRGWIW